MVEEVSVKYNDKVNVMGLLCDVQKSDGSPDEDKIIKARNLMSAAEANFTNILASKNIYSAVMKDISAVPTIFFVDNEGHLAGKVYTGGRSLAAWSDIIDEML